MCLPQADGKIIIYRFIANMSRHWRAKAGKSLSFLAEPLLCERERLSHSDAYGRVSLIYLK